MNYFRNKLKKWMFFPSSHIPHGETDAFTLVEMMVVTGMLGILMGVAVTGLGSAREQARFTKANVEVRELVNAWLAYEAAYDDWPVEMEGEELEATEENLKELINGEDGIVYLNVPIVNGAFRDPWGTPYKFRIVKEQGVGKETDKFLMSITFPNRERFYGRE